MKGPELLIKVSLIILDIRFRKIKNFFPDIGVVVIITIIIIIGSTALGGPWPPHANVASDLYPGHSPTIFYNPFSLRLPLHRQRYQCFSTEKT